MLQELVSLKPKSPEKLFYEFIRLQAQLKAIDQLLFLPNKAVDIAENGEDYARELDRQGIGHDDLAFLHRGGKSRRYEEKRTPGQAEGLTGQPSDAGSETPRGAYGADGTNPRYSGQRNARVRR